MDLPALNLAPFDRLSPAERSELAASANIRFFADEAVIFAPGDPVEVLYVVYKGIVRELDGDELVAVYREQDGFEARQLVGGVSRHRFVVQEEALLYALPRSTLLALTERNPAFGTWFYAGIAARFDTLARQGGQRELQSLLSSRVDEAGIRPAVFLDGQATLLEAALSMRAERLKSVLVRDGGRVGIFTTSDLRDAYAEAQPPDTRLAERSCFTLIGVAHDAFLFDALLEMTRHNVQRVVVFRDGEPSGVLEQIDLLAFFSNHSHLIAQQIEQAGTLAELATAARAIDRLIELQANHGIKVPQLARLVQALNGRLFARAWALVTSPDLLAQSCLVVLGSEGRGEQLLKTDQDNALILADDADPADFAEPISAFRQALSDFGYPPCPGGVMLDRPDWQGRRQDWHERLYRWVYLPEAESPLWVSVFCDAQAVAGDAALLADCRDYLAGLVRDDVGWLARLARPVEQFDGGGSLFEALLHRDAAAQVDLKKSGLFPVVHGLRVLALQYGIAATNSFERLAGLTEAGRIDAALASELGETLAYLMTLKLKAGLNAVRLQRPADNQVRWHELSGLERDLLKDALTVVKQFKSLLRHHYRLGAF